MTRLKDYSKLLASVDLSMHDRNKKKKKKKNKLQLINPSSGSLSDQAAAQQYHSMAYNSQ
jgi:hypothetical protein